MVIRVVVGDDDAAFRSAAVGLLGADPRIEVVGEAADGGRLVEVVEATRPHVVLVDVRMPSGGVAAARALTEAGTTHGGTGQPVVAALTAETSLDLVEEMLRAGAVGYLVKGRLGSALADLVARLHDGEVIVAAPGAALVLRRLLRGNHPPETPRT